MNKYHYTYQISNTRLQKHYIGVRSSSAPPLKDLGTKYFSSSTDKDFLKDQRENPGDYEYMILGLFSDRNLAVKGEIELHEGYDVGRNPRFYNRAIQTSVGFDTSGNDVFWITNDIREKLAERIEIDFWIYEGWKLGRLPDKESTKKSKSAAMIKRWSNKERRAKQSEIQKIVQSSPEAKRRKSEASRGKQRNKGKHWSVDDTSRYREANLGERNPQYGRTYKPYYNPTTNERIRIYSDFINQNIPEGYLPGIGKRAPKKNKPSSETRKLIGIDSNKTHQERNIRNSGKGDIC
jgi:hypothetical protein